MIKFNLKTVYGRKLYYPVSDQAHALVELINPRRSTLNQNHINRIMLIPILDQHLEITTEPGKRVPADDDGEYEV